MLPSSALHSLPITFYLSNHLFANRLVAPFVFIALFFLYLAWQVDDRWAVWMVPFLVIATVIFIFASEINWWWYSRRPPQLDAGLERLLIRHCGFYQRLDTAGKQRFRDRVVLFRLGTEWTPMGWPEETETLPADIELALAAQAVTLSFHKPQFLFEQFEKIIVYPQLFLTPEYPFPHTSELYEEDGCLIFSAQQIMLGFTQPAQRYNVALHEYARAFVLTYPQMAYPALQEEHIWGHLQTISGMSRQQVEGVIGISSVEALPVVIHHFFTFPERFRAELPEIAATLEKVFS